MPAHLRDWHGDECAMCGHDLKLVMDHDHKTGLNRGVLCRWCNMAEAYSDAPRWIAWRDGANPAGVLGLREEYKHLMPGAAILERMQRAYDADAADDVADLIAAAVAR